MNDPDLNPSLRALFAAGTGDEPPLRLTPSSVLESGKAARRRRRGTLVAAGSGLSVVAVVAAASAVALVGAGGTVPVADGPGRGDAAVACATPAPSGPRVPGPGRIPVTPSPDVTASPTSGIPVSPSPGIPVSPSTGIPVSPSPAGFRASGPALTPTPVRTLPGDVGPASPRPEASPRGTDSYPEASPTRPEPSPRGTDSYPEASPTRPEPSPRGTDSYPEASPTRPEPAPRVEVYPRPSTCDPAPTPEVSPTRAAPETEAQRLTRLTTALREALQLPAGGRLVPSTAADGHRALTFRTADGGYMAAADVRDPLGTSSIKVEIHTDPHPPAMDCAAPDCVRTARGDVVLVSRSRQGSGTFLSVQAMRTDDTSVYVAVTDYAGNEPREDGAGTPRSERPTLPWTAAQLTTLALTPTLHL